MVWRALFPLCQCARGPNYALHYTFDKGRPDKRRQAVDRAYCNEVKNHVNVSRKGQPDSESRVCRRLYASTVLGDVGIMGLHHTNMDILG